MGSTNASFSQQLQSARIPKNSSNLFKGSGGGMSLAGNVGVGATAFGSLFGALGSLEAGKAQESLAQFNAEMSEMQAEDAKQRGREAEKQFRQEIKQLIGKQKTSYAAQNVQLGDEYSSASEVELQTRLMGEEDALNIRSNAMREAFGFKSNAISQTMQGRYANMQARDQAAGTLLTGSNRITQMYRMFGS